MTYDSTLALSLVKARLNILPANTTLDEYLIARIEATAQELEGSGIHIRNDAEDTMLLVDMTVWQYQSRDKEGGMPEWLRLRRRERWLRDRAKGGEAGT